MLVNTDRDGSHRARPLTIANRDANEPAPAAPGGGQSPQQVTFITSRQRGLVDDLEAEPSVCATDGAAEAREAARHGALDPSGRGGAPGRP